MKLNINVYHHNHNEEKIMALLDGLTAADQSLKASVVAAIAYVHTIPQQIADAIAAAQAANPGVDLTALGALTTDIQSQADALSGALPAPVAAAATTAAAVVNADPAPTTADTVTAAATDAVASDASAPSN